MVIDLNKLIVKYKTDIEQLCKALQRNWHNARIEVDDLVQESYLKLMQLAKNDFDIDDKSKVMIAIKNRLLNYKRDFDKDPISNADSLDFYLDSQSQ